MIVYNFIMHVYIAVTVEMKNSVFVVKKKVKKRFIFIQCVN